MQLLQSRALPLGYPAVEGAINIVEFVSRASSLRRFPFADGYLPAAAVIGTTIDVNGGTYACNVTSTPTNAASTMLCQKT